MATSKKKTVKKKSANIAKKKTVKKKVISLKTPAKKSAAPKAKAKVKTKAKAKTAKPKSGKIKVTPEQHHKMICEAAYYISLERTHETVNPTEDWLQAEAAINKICSIS